jgi:hypothetical protein
MAFSPQFESQYIQQFSKIVRRGASPEVYSLWTNKIRDALAGIADPELKTEALERITRISNYVSVLIEDRKSSQDTIADEIEELAAFVSKI